MNVTGANYAQGSFYTAQNQKVMANESSKTGTARSEPSGTVMDNIGKKYDMHNMTPSQITQLSQELNDHDLISSKDFMAMLTHGAGFRGVNDTGADSSIYDNSPIDYIAKIKSMIQFSQGRGEASAVLDRILNIVNTLDARATIPEKGFVV